MAARATRSTTRTTSTSLHSSSSTWGRAIGADRRPHAASDVASHLAADVAARLDTVRRRVQAAGGGAVRIVAVTKSFGIDAIEAAAAAGIDDIGENYAKEAVDKLTRLGHECPGVSPRLHFIGQLQRNKVRALAPIVARWDTVDRAALADEIARRAPGAQVLVQVDTSLDAGAGPTTSAGAADDGRRGGCSVTQVPALVEHCSSKGLAVRGLLTIGPATGGPAAARAGFATVRALADWLGLGDCSMGMSDDLEVAVGEGATEVRIGSALFGPRPRRM